MKIAFRADASDHIGSGHIMRCLTLAKELKENGAEVSFICESILPLAAQLISDAHIQLILLETSAPDEQDIMQLINLLNSEKFDWLIIDHYQFDADYEMAVKPYVKRIMVIDDLANRAHQCDFLLDQTPGRSDATYKSLVNHQCELLLSSQYALIRDEFIQHQQQLPDNYSISTILVTLGGSDPQNLYQLILDSLINSSRFDKFTFTFIAPKAVLPLLKKTPHLKSNIYLKSLSDNLAEEMQHHDLIITNCGVTLLERCAIGKPGIGIMVADNQKDNAHAIAELGAGLVIDSLVQLPHKLIDSIDRLSLQSQDCLDMIAAGQSLVDGHGKRRVAQKVLSW